MKAAQPHLNRVPMSIRDFAVPVPRTGSIEALSGYGRATQEGQEIHTRVQKRRAESHADYRAEVTLQHTFEREGYSFEIAGRMDGIFDSDPPKIEEIKSSFSARELQKKISSTPDHPYCLQLLTYGYFYWFNEGVLPKLCFHLVSTRNNDFENHDLELDIPFYESWLERRLDELVSESKKSEKRASRRRKSAQSFAFPFENPRPGQIELIGTIQEGMLSHQRMLFQAPTGLGKTAGVLYPTLKEALSRGQRVIYVTPKNSQHAVAEEAIERFQNSGAKVKSLTITAKSKICFKNEPLCNPEYCEYARDHYTKVAQHELIDVLAKKKKLSAQTFKKIGEEFEVCPFELQLDMAHEVEAVICDYNYVFAPRSSFGRMTSNQLGQEGKPNLVIDEAHNLPTRAMDYYSPALSSVVLEKMRETLRQIPSRFRIEAEGLLDECIQAILECRPESGPENARIDPPAHPFVDQEGRLRAFLSRYLDSDVDIQPRDPVLRLCFYWTEFTSALEFVTDPEHTEFFTTFHSHPTGGTIKITCCDASKMLKTCYDDYEQVVGFSATLKPFDFYAKLSGLDLATLKTAEFQSPFPKSQRKLLIIPQVSTKFSERQRNYPRIAEAISRIAALKSGNYLVFFPSFDFMEHVLEHMDDMKGFTLLRQERDMKAAQIEAVLEQLRLQTWPTLVFAVQGGVFSEGVDYPGQMVIGAFVIGPPLPSFDLEREHMREYYQKNYRAGFDYTYAFPAMAKAVQAAGRVIRSETDKGIIVLMDNRFIQSTYSQSMPQDWFESSPRELVSASILREVAEFWDAPGPIK